MSPTSAHSSPNSASNHAAADLVPKGSAFSLAFGVLVAWSGVADAAVVVTDVNASFLNNPANISFNGATQFTLSRMNNQFGPKNFISTSGANLYAQQVLAGRVITDQIDPIPGNVSLKFASAATPTDLLSVPQDVDFFVPLQVVNGSTQNFGYAQIGTANGGATLTSYAFETTPGQSIIAGARPAAPVPEPSSLAILAVGAAGVLASRRRRRAAAAV